MNQLQSQVIQDNDFELLTEKEAAKFLKVSQSFLAKNRCYKQGNDLIPFAKLSSRAIRYSKSTLIDWIESQLAMFEEEVSHG